KHWSETLVWSGTLSGVKTHAHTHTHTHCLHTHTHCKHTNTPTAHTHTHNAPTHARPHHATPTTYPPTITHALMHTPDTRTHTLFSVSASLELNLNQLENLLRKRARLAWHRRDAHTHN